MLNEYKKLVCKIFADVLIDGVYQYFGEDFVMRIVMILLPINFVGKSIFTHQ